MNARQFLWGLSYGIMALALAGAFWLGLAIGMAAGHVSGWVPAVGTILQAGGLVTLFWAAIRLRRQSAFRASDLRGSEERDDREAARIRSGFAWTVAGQSALIAGAVWWCLRFGAEPLIWPLIGLVVSLHFAPLARIFHVRAYYVTAAAGTIVSLVGLATTGLRSVVLLGTGMALVMWLSAIYLLRHATRMADRTVREPWAT